jgi:ATP-binding cassette subfamily B protein
VIVFVLWIGARQVSVGQMSLGELTQFVMYAALVAGSIGALSEVWGDLQRAAGATERLVELMQAQPQIKDPPQQKAVPPAADLQQGDVIRFEEVCFSYPSRPGTLALDHLTFSVSRGARVALVGPSGAGKSTVFALLLRFYDFAHGDITLFARALRDWPITMLREQMAIVPQEPVIFAASAMENIRYGRLEATDAEVIAASKSAHAHDFISALPDGYASFLGERGVRLSGGQRQRISIARAILKNPPILLLDEATSSLDAESEQEVQRALDEILPGRTSLTIAHRLSTVQRADQILVLDQGRLVEQGSHESLLAQNGLYARLAKLQFL